MANEISNGIWGISHNPVWGTLDSRKTESGGIDVNSIAIALKPYFDLKSDIDHTHDSLYLKLSGGSLSGPVSSQPGKGVRYILGTAGQGAGLYVKKDTLLGKTDICLLSYNIGYKPSSLSVQSTQNQINLYSCQIYKNDVLVRNFIPCYRKTDNEPLLYDTVSESFFRSGNPSYPPYLGPDV